MSATPHNDKALWALRSDRLIYNERNFHLLLPKGPVARFGADGFLARRSRYGNALAASFGLIPGGEAVTPVAQIDWKECIEECHRLKLFAMYHRQASTLPQKPSQNGLNYCWAWSARATLENARILEGQPAVVLAPVSLGWLVNWRNDGFWLDSAIAGIRERGIASATFCPDQYDYTGRSFKTGWEQDAMNYRLGGEIWDTNRSEGIVSMISQCLGILRTGTTIYDAYNSLSHAMALDGLFWDETQQYNLIFPNFNSWEDGYLLLGGVKGVPDEGYGAGMASLPKAA